MAAPTYFPARAGVRLLAEALIFPQRGASSSSQRLARERYLWLLSPPQLSYLAHKANHQEFRTHISSPARTSVPRTGFGLTWGRARVTFRDAGPRDFTRVKGS